MKTVKQRVRRLLALIPFLRKRQGVTIGELARFMGVADKQVLEDLDCILMCGVPPYLPDDYVTYWIDDDRVYVAFADQFRAPARLSLEEALSLKVFIRGLEPSLRGLGAKHIMSIEEKLNRATSACVSLNEIVEEKSTMEADARMRQIIDRAIEGKKCLRIEYFSYARGVLSERIVAPLRLTSHKGMLYLKAFCTTRNQPRSFRFDRIKSVEIREGLFKDEYCEPVTPKDSLNVEDHGDASFEVKVRFNPLVARWAVEMYPGIINERLEDGSVIAAFKTDNPRWAALWVLPYCENVEILEPESVRNEIRGLLKEMLVRQG